MLTMAEFTRILDGVADIRAELAALTASFEAHRREEELRLRPRASWANIISTAAAILAATAAVWSRL